MNAQQNLVVCPSCGKRYQLSDFKEDKLVCSACGREIPRFMSVGGVDEEKYVKLYLRRVAKSNLWGAIATFPLAEMLFAWLLTLDISFWWKILVFLLAVSMPVYAAKEFGAHWKVLRIFKANHYRLAGSVRAFKKWYDGLSQEAREDIPDVYKNGFTEDLENYVGSHAEIRTTYERTGGGMAGGAASPQGAPQTPPPVQPLVPDAFPDGYRLVVPGGQCGETEYDYPPEQCPGCGRLYSVADFSSDNVQCRHCGKVIKIKCRVADKDIHALCERFLKRLAKQWRSVDLGMMFILAVFGVVISRQVGAVGWDAYFASWHVLTMFFACFIFLGLTLMSSERRTLKAMMKSDVPDFLAIEIFIKRNMDSNSVNDEEKALLEFKKSLFDLYRSKGKTMGKY